MSSSRPEQPWYADGLAFTCTQCGNCCTGAPGYVWLADGELEAIAEHLKLHPHQFENRHTRRVGRRRSLLEHDNGDCEFLVQEADGKRRCGIYAVRPIQCRTWPFWQSTVKSPAAWAAASRGCPGMNHGTVHALPVIQAALAKNEDADLPL